MPRPLPVFLAFFVAYFLSYFFRTANAVLAGDLVRDVGLDPAGLGLMTSLFFGAFAAAQLPLGPAFDRYGSRFVTPLLMLAAALGAWVFSRADGFAGLALGRALIGLGMAGVLTGALQAFAGWFPPHRFATVTGLFVGLGSLGALAATRPLRVLADLYGWRGTFEGAAVATLAAAALLAWLGRNRPASGRKAEEARGDAAEGRDEGDGGGFGRIFRSGAFRRVALLNLAVTGSLFAWQTLWAGPHLASLGRDPLLVGTLLQWIAIGSTAGFFLLGPLADRGGLVRVTFAGSALLLATQVALLLAAPAWPDAVLAAVLLLFGLGGSTSVLFFANVRAAFAPTLTGRAVTAVNLFGIGGSALLQWALGLVVGLFPVVAATAGATGATGAAEAPTAAYRAALAATTALVALALAGYAPLLRRGLVPARR